MTAIEEREKEIGIIFSFMDNEIEDDTEKFISILDPIRESFPLLANTGLYKNDTENLLLNYKIDKNIFLKYSYDDFKPKYEKLLKKISVVENKFESFQKMNNVKPKTIDLREFHKILQIFRKKNFLDLIREEKNPIMKNELIAKFISSDNSLDRNKIEKILPHIPTKNYLIQNQIYKEIADKSIYDYKTIEKWDYKLKGIKKKDEVRRALIMAYEILETHDILSPTEYRDAILIYENGIWKETPIEVLDKIVINYLEKKIWRELKEKQIIEIKQKITADIINIITRIILRKTQCSIKDLNIYKNYINVKNGIIDYSHIADLKFYNHSRLFLNRIQIPVIYNKDANCPHIKKFIREVLENIYEDLIYEFLGDSLTGNIRYQKALLFTGEGANGKSTLIELCREFMGFENCSATPLQKLLEDKFATANLENILLNLAADIPRKPLNYTEIFKQVVGDRTLMGEKKFRKEYEFYNHSKHLFSCNIIPPTYDKTHAFYRRWIIVPFIRIFKEEEQQNQDALIQKLTSEEELSGFLNNVLRGLKNLETRGHYKKEYSIETETQWELFSNPLLQFMDNYIEINESSGVNEDFEIDKDHFLFVYNRFLKKHNQPEIKGTNTLTGKINYLKEYGPKIKTKCYQKNQIKYYVYTNIKFNDKAKIEFALEDDKIEDSKKDIFKNIPDIIEKLDRDKIFVGQSKSNLIQLEILMKRLKKIFEENEWKMLERKGIMQILELDENLDKKYIENALDDLLEEGILFEPKIDMIKFKQVGVGGEKEKGDI